MREKEGEAGKGPHDNNNEVRNHVHHVGVNRPINIITPYHTDCVCSRAVRVFEMDKDSNKISTD